MREKLKDLAAPRFDRKKLFIASAIVLITLAGCSKGDNKPEEPKPPVIVEPGDEEKDKDVVNYETKVVPFKTVTEKSTTHEVGYKVTKQEGVDGEAKLTFTNGELTDEEVTKKPVDKIVVVGVKSEGKVTKNVSIPYGKVTKEDSSMEKGQKRVVAGKKGTKVETYNVVKHDGKVVKETLLNSEVKTKAVDEITYVGTKAVVRTKNEKTNENIPFETVVLTSEYLTQKEVLVAEGSNGTYEITTAVTTTDGKVTNKTQVDKVMVKKPVAKVVVVKGDKTSPELTLQDWSNNVKAEPKVEVSYDKTKTTDFKEVKVKGQTGVMRNSGIEIIYKGKTIDNHYNKPETLVELINQKETRGTIVYEAKKLFTDAVIPNQSETYYIPGYKGADIVTKGSTGIITSEYLIHLYDGVENNSKLDKNMGYITDRELIEDVITKMPVADVTLVSEDKKTEFMEAYTGVVAKNIDTVTPFKTESVEDEAGKSRFKGDDVVVVEGVEGLDRVVEFKLTVNGKDIVLRNDKVTVTKPVDKYISLGQLEEVIYSEESAIPFEVNNVKDKQLLPVDDKRVTVVDVDGKEGIYETVYRKVILHGVEVEAPVVQPESGVKLAPVTQEERTSFYLSVEVVDEASNPRPVPFKVVETESFEKPFDTPNRVDVVGVDGIEEDIFRTVYGIDENGKDSNPISSESVGSEVTTQPVTQEETRYEGSKEITETYHGTTGYTTRHEDDESFRLLVGQSEVKVKGVDGKYAQDYKVRVFRDGTYDGDAYDHAEKVYSVDTVEEVILDGVAIWTNELTKVNTLDKPEAVIKLNDKKSEFAKDEVKAGKTGTRTEFYRNKLDSRTQDIIATESTKDDVIVAPVADEINRGSLSLDKTHENSLSGKDTSYMTSYEEKAHFAEFGFNSTADAVNKGLGKAGFYGKLNSKNKNQKLQDMAQKMAMDMENVSYPYLDTNLGGLDIGVYVWAQPAASNDIQVAETGSLIATDIASSKPKLAEELYGIGVAHHNNTIYTVLVVTHRNNIDYSNFQETKDVFKGSFNADGSRVFGYDLGVINNSVLKGFNGVSKEITDSSVFEETITQKPMSLNPVFNNGIKNKTLGNYTDHFTHGKPLEHSPLIGYQMAESLSKIAYRDAGTPFAIGAMSNYHSHGLTSFAIEEIATHSFLYGDSIITIVGGFPAIAR